MQLNVICESIEERSDGFFVTMQCTDEAYSTTKLMYTQPVKNDKVVVGGEYIISTEKLEESA